MNDVNFNQNIICKSDLQNVLVLWWIKVGAHYCRSRVGARGPKCRSRVRGAQNETAHITGMPGRSTSHLKYDFPHSFQLTLLVTFSKMDSSDEELTFRLRNGTKKTQKMKTQNLVPSWHICLIKKSCLENITLFFKICFRMRKNISNISDCHMKNIKNYL